MLVKGLEVGEVAAIKHTEALVQLVLRAASRLNLFQVRWVSVDILLTVGPIVAAPLVEEVEVILEAALVYAIRAEAEALVFAYPLAPLLQINRA